MKRINDLSSRKFFPHMVIAAVTLIVFVNTFANEFVYDDTAFILDNRHIRDLKNIGGFFVSSDYFSAASDFIIYRPLVTVTFALDYQLWKLNPFGYHILNLLFHMLSGMMLYAVANLILKDGLLALFAALLFVTHPVQTEAVTWIAGRGNAMSFFFFLASFCFFIKYRMSGKSARTGDYALSLIMYVLALFSKEMVIVLPFILMAYDVYFPGRSAPRQSRGPDFVAIKSYIPFFVLTLLYLLLRHHALGRTSQTTYWGGGIAPTMLTMSKVLLLYYVRYMIFPINLCLDRDMPLSFSIAEPSVLVSLAGIVFLFFLIIRLYGNSRDTRGRAAPSETYAARTISFGMLFFFITLLPVSNIVPLQALFAERFLYFSTAGFCMVLAVVAGEALRLPGGRKGSRKDTLYLMVLLVAVYACRTMVRNGDWKNGFTLWSSTVKENPASYKAHNNLGAAYGGMGRYADQLREYEESIRIKPDYAEAHNNLGAYYEKLGDYDRALEEYESGVRFGPDLEGAHNNLGVAYYRRGFYDRAIEAYEKAIELNDGYVDARNNLGTAYAQTGRLDEAIKEFEEVIRLYPGHKDVYKNIGLVYKMRGDYDRMLFYWDKYLYVSPDAPDAGIIREEMRKARDEKKS